MKALIKEENQGATSGLALGPSTTNLHISPTAPTSQNSNLNHNPLATQSPSSKVENDIFYVKGSNVVAFEFASYLDKHDFFKTPLDYKVNKFPYLALAFICFATNPLTIISVPIVYVLNELILKSALVYSFENFKDNAKYILKKQEIKIEDIETLISNIITKHVVESIPFTDLNDNKQKLITQGKEDAYNIVKYFIINHIHKNDNLISNDKDNLNYELLAKEIFADKPRLEFNKLRSFDKEEFVNLWKLCKENVIYNNLLLNKNYEKVAEYFINLSGAFALSYYLYNNSSKLNDITSLISNLLDKTVASFSSNDNEGPGLSAENIDSVNTELAGNIL